MRVGILQSNYLPWKGYFSIIGDVDLFVFHDDLQYTKDDWRNRNKIKTPSGAQWITIPCGRNERRLICEVSLTDCTWQKKHWDLIKENYRKAPYFKKYAPFFEEIFLGQNWTNLSTINQHIIRKISLELLDINTKFVDSRDYSLEESKGKRVIELLKKVGAKSYLSGPSAKSYLLESDFWEEKIVLDWADYSNYRPYQQLWGSFIHEVSIIDVLFNCGENSYKYIFNK